MPKFIAVGERKYRDVDSSWDDPFMEEFEGTKEDFIKLLKEKVIENELENIFYDIEWAGEIKEAFPELTELDADKEVNSEILKRRTIMYYEKTKLKSLYYKLVTRKPYETEEHKILNTKYKGNYNLK